MAQSRPFWPWGVVAGLLLAVALIWLFQGGGDPPADLQVRAPQADAQVDGGPNPLAVAPAAPGEVAGKPLAVAAEAKPDPELLEVRAGTTQPVPLDLNPQVRSVAEAIQTKSHPERVSTLIHPAAFNAQAYEADPASYLNTAEPGRVFQPAQPGPGVKQLTTLSPYLQTVEQGQAVSLKVLAPAGAPVTFTSFDLGEFSNRLTTITVKADAEGVAEAEFTGTPGTIERVNILAASPLTAGQAKYVVHVTLPEAAAR